MSRQICKGPSQYPNNRTFEEANGRWGNKYWKLDSVHEAPHSGYLVGWNQLQDRFLRGSRCQDQHSADPLDGSLGPTDSLIWSLATVFCWEMTQHITQTSRTVATPPLTMSTTCPKWSPVSVTISALKWESSISKPMLIVRRAALPPAMSSLLVLIWLPRWAPSHMWSPN